MCNGYVVVVYQFGDLMQMLLLCLLLIFLQGVNGCYWLVVCNDIVIMKVDEGGMGDLYFDGVVENVFMIEFCMFIVEQGVFVGYNYWCDCVMFCYDVVYCMWVFYCEVFWNW